MRPVNAPRYDRLAARTEALDRAARLDRACPRCRLCGHYGVDCFDPIAGDDCDCAADCWIEDTPAFIGAFLTEGPTLHTEGGRLFAGEHEVRRGWESYSGWFWFGVEEPEPGLWFGYVQGFEEEWGYFSTQELDEQIRLGLIWPIRPSDLPYAGRRTR